MSFFQVRGLTAGYGGRPVLEGISFCLEQGSVAGLLGGNGSGKTTLLKAVCGIVPHGGGCTLEGRALETLGPRALARLCGYIPQCGGIGLDISVLEVVCMGFNPWLGLLERPGAAHIEQALAALAQVGLEGRARDNYQYLSEGQKQLCLLARTMVGGGRLLLLDEPESALDFHHRRRMLGILRTWAAREGGCALVALHDPELALNHCDILLPLLRGQVAAPLRPKIDPPEELAARLSRLYGPVGVHRVRSRDGKTHLVMLPEEEIL